MSQELSVSEKIKRWGCSASIALLDPSCQIFTHPEIDGIIGYHIEKDCAIVFGDPVCPSASSPQLANAFHGFCKEQSKKLIYLTASENFAKWAMKNGCHGLLEVEEELVMDPALYPRKGSNGRLLHKKMNHAVRADVVIKEFTFHDEKTKNAILEAISQWLKGRKGPQIFLSNVDFFDGGSGKRCFYAEQNGEVVGALLLNRLEAHQGWLLSLLLTVPEAPGGTSEYLVLSVLDKLTEEKCQFFSFGVSAGEQLRDIIGLGKLSTWIARLVFKMAKRVFHLDNRRQFWKKFEPQNKRSFVLFSEPQIGMGEIFAVMKTLNASLLRMNPLFQQSNTKTCDSFRSQWKIFF